MVKVDIIYVSSDGHDFIEIYTIDFGQKWWVKPIQLSNKYFNKEDIIHQFFYSNSNNHERE